MSFRGFFFVAVIAAALTALSCQRPRQKTTQPDDSGSGDGVVTSVGGSVDESDSTSSSSETATTESGTATTASTTTSSATNSTTAATTTGGTDPSAPMPTDKPTAVSVGNPTGSGPSNGKLKLYLADAAIDTAKGFLISPVALRLYSGGQATTVALPSTSAIDLLQYQNGTKALLYDDAVPVGTYDHIAVVLNAVQPATLILANNTPASVLVPPLGDFISGITSDEPVIVGQIPLTIDTTSEPDVTMHIDLRAMLGQVPSGLPTDLLGMASSSDYWLKPVAPTFLSATVGSITGIGVSLLAQVACVYHNGLPTLVETSDCPGAAGSAVIHSLSFKVNYLPPGQYATRLYLAGSLYVDLPGLTTVTAGLGTILDAGGL